MLRYLNKVYSACISRKLINCHNFLSSPNTRNIVSYLHFQVVSVFLQVSVEYSILVLAPIPDTGISISAFLIFLTIQYGDWKGLKGGKNIKYFACTLVQKCQYRIRIWWYGIGDTNTVFVSKNHHDEITSFPVRTRCSYFSSRGSYLMLFCRWSRRSSSPWIMKVWSCSERPRSSVTPCGTCCSSPQTTSR